MLIFIQSCDHIITINVSLQVNIDVMPVKKEKMVQHHKLSMVCIHIVITLHNGKKRHKIYQCDISLLCSCPVPSCCSPSDETIMFSTPIVSQDKNMQLEMKIIYTNNLVYEQKVTVVNVSKLNRSRVMFLHNKFH